jgi:low temperature requirement protein LtrA
VPAARLILSHRRRRLVGRDPDEPGRSATPLELLYDLVFIVAFGQAANELAHYVAIGHMVTGIVGFTCAVLAITWAWGSYTWFASAYDEDDWACRVATMVQMVGVIVVALGLPDVFASIDGTSRADFTVVGIGYVVMRLPLAWQWLRASRHDPARRPAALAYLWTIAVAQAGWTALVLVELPARVTVLGAMCLVAVEIAGPVLAQRRKGGIPWHADHVAERYGLLTIVTLGEGVFGTVAAVSAVVHGAAGWSPAAALVAVAGTALTLQMWWTYFAMPSGPALRLHPERVYSWAYGHHVVIGSIAAVGAGWHVAALRIEGHATIGAAGAVLSVAGPLALFMAALYAQWTTLAGTRRPLHLYLVALTTAVLALATALAFAGASMVLCLALVAVAPAVTIVGYETVGHLQLAERLE